MAIIVDKEKKRSDIASACTDLLFDNGISNITIAQIAQTANVGKGTIYEYFINKEDIVFEIITMFIDEHKERLYAILKDNISTKEKIYYFFMMIYEDDNGERQLDIYREFLAISLSSSTPEMIEFNIRCRNKFADILNEIIQEGIDKGELIEESKDIVGALLTYQLGMVVEAHTVSLNVKDEMRQFLDTLLSLIGEKKL